MRLDISFSEINKLLAVKGLSWLELSGDGDNILVSAKGARLKLRQVDTKLNHIVFSHKGDNLFGKMLSGAGAGVVSVLKIKLPRFLTMDTDCIAIQWDKLIPQLSIFMSRVTVKGSALQVDLDIQEAAKMQEAAWEQYQENARKQRIGPV